MLPLSGGYWVVMNPDAPAPDTANDQPAGWSWFRLAPLWRWLIGWRSSPATGAAAVPGLEPPPAKNRRAAVSYVSYDKYILLADNAEDFEDALSLAEFKVAVPMVDSYNIKSQEKGLLLLPGETDAFAVYFIPSEKAKKVCRSILKAIWTNWKCGVCFADFDADNILVSGTGKVRFKDVSILRGLPEDELKVQIRNNYRAACAIIKHQVFSCHPPPEICHLLGLMRDDYEANALFHVHASLLSVAAYSGFLKDLYDFIRFSLTKDELRSLLSYLPESYIVDQPGPNGVHLPYWQVVVMANTILARTFNFRPSSYDLPADRPGQTTLSPPQIAALECVGLLGAAQASFTEEQIRILKKLKFITYLRNRNAHRLESLAWWTSQLNVQTGQPNAPFDSQGSERISHVGFPCVISDLQYEVFKLGRHKDVPMKDFF